MENFYKMLKDTYGLSTEQADGFLLMYLKEYPDVSLEMATTTLMRLAKDGYLDEFNFAEGNLKEFLKNVKK